MKANPQFTNLKPEFWAYIKTLSQEIGYTNRTSKTVKVPTIEEIILALHKLNLSSLELINEHGNITSYANLILNYFQYRSKILEDYVRPRLMDKDRANKVFQDYYTNYTGREITCPLPMNKQKGDKRNYAFLTCIVNMILDKELSEIGCDYDPRILTSVTKNGHPVRTPSRRVDGAFPSPINPIAIWEIKEYYYTTTFGSRVADGVYETLLDGMEIHELVQSGHQYIEHILIIDDYFTWWECGRSYLCRIIDMLHMGYLEEVLFGFEVTEQLPILAKHWKQKLLD